jgi:hypothetical protein
MGDFMHFSLRLNRNTPKHRKIIQFLDEMDVKKYKSKTNFLADAVLFYIECIEDGTLEAVRDKNFRGFSQEYVTRTELNERLGSIIDTIEKKIYKEILATYINSPVKTAPVQYEPEERESVSGGEGIGGKETLADNLSQYAGIMDSVMSWSED